MTSWCVCDKCYMYVMLCFSFRDYNWFWVPIVGPHIGAILGAFVYIMLIGLHFPDEEEADEYEINIDKNGEIG